jgi:hypothetical protein
VIEERKVEDSPMAEATSLDPGPSKQAGSKSKSKQSEHVESRFDYRISDEDTYLVGKAYFDVKEYDRAAIALKPIKRGPGRFLGLYARFLGIEKRINDISGPPLGKTIFTLNSVMP